MSDKTHNNHTDVELYLAAVPEPARSTLHKLREMIRELVPDAEEYMGYGMPAFKYHGPLVAYAAFKQHCGFYPMNGSLTTDMKEDLKDYKTSKGAIQFPLDKPLPAALLKKILKKRIKENEASGKNKSI